MRNIFSADAAQSQARLDQWRSFCDERIVPLEHCPIGDKTFFASAKGVGVGSTLLTELSVSNVNIETTSRTLRYQNSKPSQLWVSLVLAGSVQVAHGNYTTIDRVGDFSIRDPSIPWMIEYAGPTRVLAVELPRRRFEDMLGSSRHFAGLTVNGDLPTTTLTRSFLNNLVSVGDRLTPDAAERMTSIGIDLVVASIAERMALEPPKPLHGTLTTQRAKAYIETNLSDTTLDPSQVAAAVGVTLRHLQNLFRARGRNVAAWIWQRRLEVAAQRLSDPACMHMPIGDLAYGCGFTNQAHFSRRFRDHYGVSPRDYRHSALAAATAS